MKKIITLTVIRSEPMKILSAQEYEWTTEGHEKACIDAQILLHCEIQNSEQGMIGKTVDGYEVHLQCHEFSK